MDEAAGKARITNAKASAARRAREANAQSQRNAVMRSKVKNVEQRTDDDIMDEAAGKMRLELAAQSKARKAEEAKILAQKNAEMRNKLKNTEQRTDDDIMDEAAGKRRIELAAASKARREQETRERLKREASERDKFKNWSEQRTDDDITDEATGRARVALAKARRAHKAVEARQLAQQNANLRRRLHLTPSRSLDDSRAPSPEPQHVDEAEIYAALEAAAEARAMAVRVRQAARSGPTADQLALRKALASKSRRTRSMTTVKPVAVLSTAYTPTIGRRSTALYRLGHVTGHHPADIDYKELIEEALKDPA